MGAQAASARRLDEASRRHAAARAVAARIWQAARPACDDHPYLTRKGVAAHGLRVFKGALVVPICDSAGELHSLQFIGASGTKRFLKGGRVAGMYVQIGVAGKVVCIAEGIATGASIHAATGYTVAVAFNAGNLGHVTAAIRQCHPDAQLIVCADDDAGTPGNPGHTHARDAARATNAFVALPAFRADRHAGATDFNDLHRARGLEAVRVSIASATASADGEVDTDERGCLTPTVLDLSPQARAEWIRFHDEVERELGARGALRGVRDVAAKAAENTARLAALFHVLEHGTSGTIMLEEVRAAACIVRWHLNEAQRLLSHLDTPPSLASAIRLDAWLRNEAQANNGDRVSTKRIYQYGPNCVRDSRDLRAALAILAERGRARMEVDGRRRAVVINPALLVHRL